VSGSYVSPPRVCLALCRCLAVQLSPDTASSNEASYGTAMSSFQTWSKRPPVPTEILLTAPFIRTVGRQADPQFESTRIRRVRYPPLAPPFSIIRAPPSTLGGSSQTSNPYLPAPTYSSLSRLSSVTVANAPPPPRLTRLAKC